MQIRKKRGVAADGGSEQNGGGEGEVKWKLLCARVGSVCACVHKWAFERLPESCKVSH